MGESFTSTISDWYHTPFRSGGSAVNWILFVGLLVIAAWFWNHVLTAITTD